MTGLGIIASSRKKLLFSAFTDGACAFSLRKVYSGSTNCLRVFRDSDSDEEDFGFVDNFLDTASILDFVGAGMGYVRTWYGQGASAIDATRPGAVTTMPIIVNAGSLVTKNGKAALDFNGGTRYLDGPPLAAINSANEFSIFIVSALATATGSELGGLIGTRANATGAQDRFEMFCDARTLKRNALWRNSGSTNYFADMPAQINNTNQRLTTAIHTATQLLSYVNGVAGGTANPTGTYLNDVFRIGAQFALNNPHPGIIQEIDIFSADKSAVRAKIASNIISYWNIP